MRQVDSKVKPKRRRDLVFEGLQGVKEFTDGGCGLPGGVGLGEVGVGA